MKGVRSNFIGSNIRPGMQPGGFSTAGRNRKNRADVTPEEVRDAAIRVLDRRVQPPMVPASEETVPPQANEII